MLFSSRLLSNSGRLNVWRGDEMVSMYVDRQFDWIGPLPTNRFIKNLSTRTTFEQTSECCFTGKWEKSPGGLPIAIARNGHKYISAIRPPPFTSAHFSMAWWSEINSVEIVSAVVGANRFMCLCVCLGRISIESNELWANWKCPHVRKSNDSVPGMAIIDAIDAFSPTTLRRMRQNRQIPKINNANWKKKSRVDIKRFGLGGWPSASKTPSHSPNLSLKCIMCSSIFRFPRYQSTHFGCAQTDKRWCAAEVAVAAADAKTNARTT